MEGEGVQLYAAVVMARLARWNCDNGVALTAFFDAEQAEHEISLPM